MERSKRKANGFVQRGFYIALASVPFAIFVYSIARSPGDNALSRLIKQYETGTGNEAEMRKDLLHTTMMEQAAADRQLFAGTGTDKSGPSLRYTE